jgi:quinolinate synthase
MQTAEIVSLHKEILRLKKEKDAVILSHYYMPPQLQVSIQNGGVADFIGDSLGLSIEATKVKQKNIIFCGVRFMAETAKILNPSKNIFIPDKEAGCSLASSITAKDVKNLKKKHSGVPIIAYINTYAETKAECDICCTSRNALKIVASFDSDTLIFLPDIHMGKNLQKKIAAEIGKKLILWNGACEVHEQFSVESLHVFKEIYPKAEFLLHWEVPQETVDASLYERKGVLGSTNDILRYVGESNSRQFILASECDLGATLKSMYPQKEFITPCNKCPYMKKINLTNLLKTLESINTEAASHYAIQMDSDVQSKAYASVIRMIEFS